MNFLQNIQDFFAKTMDVASLIINEKGPVTKPSNFTDFCSNCVRDSEVGYSRCHQCDIKWGKVAAKNGRPVIYTCHAGLKDFVVPIIVKGEHIASIYGGQILTEPPDEEEFKKVAKELGIEEKECIKAIKKIKILSEEKIEKTIDFLYHAANSISEIAYANYKLSELGLDYKLSKNVSIESLFSPSNQNLPKPITEREFEVLKLLVLGMSNNEIAKELFISVHTVKAHVSSIFEKFSVEDRVQLAVKVIREGLI